jgi:hypothetical protein
MSSNLLKKLLTTPTDQTLADQLSQFQPRLTPEQLSRIEFFDVLRLGYWPVSHLSTQQHWLSSGEELNPEGDEGWVEDPAQVSGYVFRCSIDDIVHIRLAIAQGNLVDWASDHKTTQLCFDIHGGLTNQLDMDQIASESHTITQFAQIDQVIDSAWSQFLDHAWARVQQCYLQGVAADSHGHSPDAAIAQDLAQVAWNRLSPSLLQDLKKCA